MPARRARTISTASAMVNRVWAAISETRPSCSRGAAPRAAGHMAASTGLSTSNTVTSATSVAMPITMPGIISAT